jgi:hypothetical protein
MRITLKFRKMFYVAAALVGVVIVLIIYADNQISLAEIIAAPEPVIATRELSALLKAPAGGNALSPQEQPLETTITENTRCRLLRYESGEWCLGGKGNPVRVKLLEGQERGEILWVCSKQLRRFYPLP